MKKHALLISLLCLLSAKNFLAQNLSNRLSALDETAIRQVLKQYTQAWLNNDSTGILSLFEEKARLAPSGMCPIEGMANIRQFWFPNDSSATIIHGFDNDIVELSGEGGLAFSTQKTWLDWSYFKGSQKMGKEQRGYATTIFRRQSNGAWKIWRQTWTDVWSRPKPDGEIGKPAGVKNGWLAPQSSETRIREAIATFSEKVMAGDWDAVAAAYTDDAKIFPGGQPILQGRAAIRGYWTTSSKVLFHKITPSELKITGSEAWDWGVYEGKSIGTDGKESTWKGKYVIVWKEVSPGDWKMYLDIWNRLPD